MRNLIYVLENGTAVATLKEAQVSGMRYNMKTVEVEAEPLKMSEKRRAARVKI